MTTPHQPQPHTDGWIEWTGGECPVLPWQEVTIENAIGEHITEAARFFEWRHGIDCNIVAYHLSPSTTQSQDGEIDR